MYDVRKEEKCGSNRQGTCIMYTVEKLKINIYMYNYL